MGEALQCLDAAVKAVRQGDTEAFRAIVRATTHILRAYTAFFLSDMDVVDDLLQEVYVKVFEELDQYELGTDFLAWIKTRARFAALAERRRRERKDSAHKRYVLQVRQRLADAATSCEEENPAEARLPALQHCLEQLGAKARQLVQQRYFEGQTLEEMATRLERQASALGTALHRTRQSLARCIDTQMHGA